MKLKFYCVGIGSNAKRFSPKRAGPKIMVMVFRMLLIFTMSCCSSKMYPIYLNCDNEDIEIYVNGDFVGNGGPIEFTVTEGMTEIEVECHRNGIPVLNRIYNVVGAKNALIDIKIHDNYKFHTN